MPRANCPEQMRTKAMRSRCCGSMFAWILNTKPEKVGVVGEPAARSSVLRGARAAAPGRRSGRGRARARSCSSRCRRRRASPGRPGTSRCRTGLPAVSSSAISSRSCASAACGPAPSRSAGVVRGCSSHWGRRARRRPPCVRRAAARCARDRRRPRNAVPGAERPVDRAAGDAEHPLDLVEQVERGPCPSRSILLMKVKIGMPRMRQTWNSLMVCGSTPLTQSMSMTAVSAAARVR